MAEWASAAKIKRRSAGPSAPILVPVPPDLDFGWVSRFLGARMVPSIEMVAPDGLERVVWLEPLKRGPRGVGPVTLSIEYHPASAGPIGAAPARRSGARFVVRSAPQVPAPRIRDAITRMFDLDADLNEFAAVADRDPVLGPVVSANPRGLRLLQLLDPFEALLRAILGQQVSVAAARTVTDRLVRLVAMPASRLPSGDVIPLIRPRYAFPRPEAIAELSPARLRTIGLTRAKAAAVHAAGDAVARGLVDFRELRRAAPEDAEAALCSLPGVGPWTAAYVRLRALGDRDAFPITDLGLVRALTTLGVPRSRIQATAERWRPWRGYATLHLWSSLSAVPGPPA
jgi:AraC family transcriptional regulator, regulatory protein of adaptative response / DNA-3-methyladenine glycosylase II